MTIESEKLYTLLEASWQEAKQQCDLHGVELQYFHIFVGYAYPKTAFPNLTIESGGVKVEGRNLQDMVHELLRRKGFKAQQENMRLGPPIVEAQVASPPVKEEEWLPQGAPIPQTSLDEDSIPF